MPGRSSGAEYVILRPCLFLVYNEIGVEKFHRNPCHIVKLRYIRKHECPLFVAWQLELCRSRFLSIWTAHLHTSSYHYLVHTSNTLLSRDYDFPDLFSLCSPYVLVSQASRYHIESCQFLEYVYIGMFHASFLERTFKCYF